MSLESVRDYLKSKGADIEIFRLDDSGATVEEAAATIGVEADAIAKTLSLHLGGDVIIVVMSGNARIDNKKYRETFGAKAKMLAFEEVESLTGHPVGGLCPFGLRCNGQGTGPRVYLDESLRRHEAVYPAAGDRYHAFRISVRQLEALTGAQWVDVCRQQSLQREKALRFRPESLSACQYSAAASALHTPAPTGRLFA